MPSGQNVTSSSAAPAYSMNRSNAVAVRRPAAHAAIAMPAASPASRARKIVARQPRRNRCPAHIRTTSTSGVPLRRVGFIEPRGRGLAKPGWLVAAGGAGILEVLLCSVRPRRPRPSSTHPLLNADRGGDVCSATARGRASRTPMSKPPQVREVLAKSPQEAMAPCRFPSVRFVRLGALFGSVMLIVAVAVGYVARRADLAHSRDVQIEAAASIASANLGGFIKAVELSSAVAADPEAAVESLRDGVRRRRCVCRPSRRR